MVEWDVLLFDWDLLFGKGLQLVKLHVHLEVFVWVKYQ